MYKCGWNGCEKAYGTLNHLNAHVTMQSHGAKRTPEGESDLRCFKIIARVFFFSANPSCCRKSLDWVSAGWSALVSYTRSRGAAVAWSTAEVSLHRYPFPPRQILEPCHGPPLSPCTSQLAPCHFHQTPY